MPAVKDLCGKQFGRLLVVQRAGSKNGNSLWECICDCGNTTFVKSNNLTCGTSKSCGCLERELRVARISTHRLSKTRLYRIWENMKKRCYCEAHQAYKNYGQKGVVVCDEWKTDFKKFYDWAITSGYKDNLTIDRINVDGDYEPNNCQWITRSENTKKAWEDRRSKRV